MNKILNICLFSLLIAATTSSQSAPELNPAPDRNESEGEGPFERLTAIQSDRSQR